MFTRLAAWLAGTSLAICAGYATEQVAAQGYTIAAGPLRVLDRAGLPIVVVGGSGGRGLKVFGKADLRQPAVALMAEQGPEFVAASLNTGRTIRVNPSSVQFIERTTATKTAAPKDQVRMFIGPGAKGAYGLRLFSQGGTGPTGTHFVGGIGASDGQSGLISVGDAGGTPRATVRVDANKGMVAVIDETLVNSFVRLTEGQNRGGRLEVTDNKWLVVVEAGVTESGVGVVRAGPRPIRNMGTQGSSPSVLVGR